MQMQACQSFCMTHAFDSSADSVPLPLIVCHIRGFFLEAPVRASPMEGVESLAPTRIEKIKILAAWKETKGTTESGAGKFLGSVRARCLFGR